MTNVELGERPDLLSGWRYHAVIWSAILAATGYLGFALWSGWKDVATVISQVGWDGIAITLLLSLANYGLRFIRWQIYLKSMGYPMAWRPSLKIYLAGFALTTTPAKAGEALRGVLLKRWAVPYPISFAAFLSERLSDLLAVVMLALFGLSFYPAAQPLIVIGAVGVLAALCVLSNEGLLLRLYAGNRGSGRIMKLLHHLFAVLLQARRCHAPLILIGASGLSLTAWAAEAFAFHLILQWMGLDLPLAFAVFVYAISMLAGALSFMPGGLGGAEATMVALLMWKGLLGPAAVAATLIIRLATLWFAVMIGICLLLKTR